MFVDSPPLWLDTVLGAVANGWLDAAWWQMLAFALLTTHITIVAVTLYLHRCQAHRALDLHPAVAHILRAWLWLTTGMITREWVAIHRKHHAKCETADDPHSPVTRGLAAVLWRGTELYRAEARVVDTLQRYGTGTPDDWLERHVYRRHVLGVSLLLVAEVLAFGAAGLAVWAVQMLWIPFWAAGVINGLGHHSGYRNFETPDASTNIVPWGIVIGGEELHNNHHTYPTSAKFSVKRHEVDLGWGYVRLLERLRLAQVRRRPPRWVLGERRDADAATLEALIANRYQVMASCAKAIRATCGAELARLREQGAKASGAWQDMRLARRWLHRDAQHIPSGVQASLAAAMVHTPALAKWVAMREDLRALWTRTNVSADQLVADLQDWCRRAEASGVERLREFSLRLRATVPTSR